MPLGRYHSLAETILGTFRRGFELYSQWYQHQEEERKRLKRKRQQQQDDDDDDNNQPPGRRPVVDSSSDSSSGTPTWQREKKRRRLLQRHHHQLLLQQEEEDAIQQFAVGTRVRKHFPIEGWFDGQVIQARFNASLNTYCYGVEYEDRDGQDVVTQAELADLVTNTRSSFRDPTLFSLDEFVVLWERLRPEEIEKSSVIRRANTKVATADSETQHNAQYGRFLPQATNTLFRVLRLKRSDIFLDVGHGIGNSCLQAAYCTGCESRGIEVVKDRFNISLDFQEEMAEMTRLVDRREGRMRIPGEIVLRHGDLADPSRHNWLVRANKVFVNNFNGVFAERMVPQESSSWHLDHYIAGLFASMEENSLMFTLSDLQLGPTQKQVNKWRIDNNLEPSPNASFFDVVKVELGEAGQVFSWSTSCKAPAYAYVYRRVKQDPALRSAVLLCCNIQCEHSRKGTPIPAVTFNRDGKAVVGTCECKMTLRSNRRIPQIQVSEYLDPRGDYSDWGM